MERERTHELLSKIKALASEMQRTPTREEFLDHYGFTKHLLDTLFGGWTPLLQASGLPQPEHYKAKRLKASELFYAPVVEKAPDLCSVSNILPFYDWPWYFAYGDTHLPWVHVDKLTLAHLLLERHYKRWIHEGKRGVFYVFQLGDLYDMYAAKKFPGSVQIYNAFEEYALGRQMAEKFWLSVQRMAPLAKCVQLLGNHDVRPYKRVIEAAPNAEPFFKFHDAFKFEGVETVFDSRQEYKFGRMLAHHGWLGKLGDHREYFNANFLGAHTHRGGVVAKNKYDVQTRTEYTIVEVNAGYLGDPAVKVLGYTPTKISHWTHGVSQGDDLGPQFVPL